MKFYDVVGRAALRQEMDEGLQAEIMARGDAQSDDRWWLGDLASEWARKVKEYAIPCSIADVYVEIAYLYGDAVSPSTVKYYRQVAEFFARWARDEYHMLPWSHFDLAMRRGESWQEVMETAVRYMDAHNGRRPSRRWLEMELSGELDRLMEQRFHDDLPDPVEAEILTAPDLLMYDEMVAESTNTDFGAVTVQAAVKFVDVLSGSLDRFPVGDELKGRLRSVLGGLREVLDDMLGELS